MVGDKTGLDAAGGAGSSEGRPDLRAAQGVQVGSGDKQYNFFAPVTARLFAGSFERLKDVHLDPALLERDLDLAHFTGRTELIGQIDSFIATRERGYVVVQAEAGVGKSSLAAHLAGTRPWLHHFTRLPGGRSPETARKSLAAQLIARWNLLDEWAPDGVLPAAAGRQDWFDRLLRESARRRDETEPGKPIVIVVDGLDEADPDTSDAVGLPLGLPPNLPDGVYVVATTRFGIDRALHPVRNPADWLQIEVEGPANLTDMRHFIEDITGPDSWDSRLRLALDRSGIDQRWFRQVLERRCAGVWIYLRFVLDEIRDGVRDPSMVDQLPDDLAGYYAEQLERWHADRGKRLRLLGVLGAARAPLTVTELAAFAAVPAYEAAVFVEETARAFLSRRDDPAEPTQWSVRHQSLRELLTGAPPRGRPDLRNLTERLASQHRSANDAITEALTPSGAAGKREWRAAGSYARDHLAAHAAPGGQLDDLVSDPGFLTFAAPGSILTQRARLQTPAGRRALAAYEMSLDGWESYSDRVRFERLAANAARVRAASLLAACTTVTGSSWPIRWSAWSGRAHRTLIGHHDWVNAVAIGRAGDHDIIASGSADGAIRVWDAVTGEPAERSPVGHERRVRAVATGRAGGRDLIASASDDRTVRIWDAVTCELVQALTGHQGSVRAVAVGRRDDRDIVVSGSADRSVLLWDLDTGEIVDRLNHPAAVYAVAIGQAGNLNIIASGSGDGTVTAWHLATGEIIHTLTGHDGPVYAVAIGRAEGRNIIASGSADQTVRVWDPLTGQPIASLPGHSESVRAVALGQSGGRDLIASGSADGSVRVWDAATGQHSATLRGHENWVQALAIGPAGDRDIIASGCGDRKVRIWDAAMSEQAETASTGDWVYSVAIGRVAGRDVVASSSDDHTVRTWDAATGEPVRVLPDHGAPVRAVALGRAGNQDVIASGCDDAQVRLWDAATGGLVRTLPGHQAKVRAVAIGQIRDLDIVASGGDDHKVRIWNAATGEPIHVLRDHGAPVRAVALGRAGNQHIFVTGGDDHKVRIWDAASGEPLQTLHDHHGPVTAVAVGRANDRDIIASGSADRSVRVWDAATREPIHVLHDHQGPVHALAIGRSGARIIIVSGSDDRKVRVWDVATWAKTDTLTGHDHWVNSVAAGNAGADDCIVSGSGDGAVFLRSTIPGS